MLSARVLFARAPDAPAASCAGAFMYVGAERRRQGRTVARPDKAAAVAEITDAFRDSTAAVLTEYRGLSVAELTELRRSLGATTRYAVVKNTLTQIAARQAGVADLDALLQGPTAIAFVGGDAVEAAKGVRDFARTHPLLVIKGAVLEGRMLSADEVRRLADLESREVLLAKLAGGMKASLSQAVALFAAPLSQAARLAEALRAKAELDPSILRGEAGSPAAAMPDASAEEAPAATSSDEPPATSAVDAALDVVAEQPALASAAPEAAADDATDATPAT